jgi:hypothetical protein
MNPVSDRIKPELKVIPGCCPGFFPTGKSGVKPPHSKSEITSATLALSPASLSPAKLFSVSEIGLTLRLS